MLNYHQDLLSIATMLFAISSVIHVQILFKKHVRVNFSMVKKRMRSRSNWFVILFMVLKKKKSILFSTRVVVSQRVKYVEEVIWMIIAIYRYSGMKFRCSVLIAPVKNESCDIILYILEFTESNARVAHQRKCTHTNEFVHRMTIILMMSNELLDKHRDYSINATSMFSFANNVRYVFERVWWRVCQIGKLDKRSWLHRLTSFTGHQSHERTVGIANDFESPLAIDPAGYIGMTNICFVVLHVCLPLMSRRHSTRTNYSSHLSIWFTYYMYWSTDIYWHMNELSSFMMIIIDQCHR
jgi:hypothetical protein